MTARRVCGVSLLLPALAAAVYFARSSAEPASSSSAVQERSSSAVAPPAPSATPEATRVPSATYPTRIASLTLGGDEMLSALIPPERLVCVTSLADDDDISNVHGFYSAALPRIRELDLERIIGLTPDLVCAASYNSADVLQVLERVGLKVYRGWNIRSLDEIEAAILDLGNQVGAEERARVLVERFAAVRRGMKERLANVKHRPGVLYWASGFCAGKDSTIDDVIREAGGVNAAAEKGVAGDIDPERVIGIDPDFVLCPLWPGYETDGGIEKHVLLRNLRAVQTGNVVRIPARLLTSVSQFACEGLEPLARRLHPECFGKSAPSATKLSAEHNP